MISYHKFNEKNKLFELINLIENYTCGLISDAGYPTISDPGNLIISTIRDKLKNIHIEVINCANAAICALTGSGLNTSNFYFHGFLSKKNNEAIKELSKLITINTTIILYESVYRVVNTLNLMNKFFMDKKICVVRELTKQNETYYFGTINEILKKLTLKGEFVILIDNSKTITKIKQEFENKHIEEIMELISLGLKLKNACKFVAKKYNLDNSKLYAYFQSKK